MKRLYGDARFAPVATFYRDHFARMRRGLGSPRRRRRSRASCGTGTPGASSSSRARRPTATCPGCSPAPEGIRPQLELGVAGFERIVGRKPTGRVAPRVRVPPELRRARSRAPASASRVLDTHGIAPRAPAPALRRARAHLQPQRRRLLRARRRVEPAGLVARRGLPGRRVLPRLLPRHRLRPARGRPDGRGRGRRLAPHDGAQVLPDHRQGRREGALPAGRRARAGVGARGQLRLQSRPAGRGTSPAGRCPCRPSSSRRTTRSSTGTGGSRVRCSSRRVFRRLREASGEVEADHPPPVPRPPPGARSRRRPSASSWGAGGYGEVWVGREAAWTWRHVHHATRYARWLVEQHRDADGRRGQALDQAIRELLLLQSSDWPFILKTGTATRYAEARIRAHVHRLRHLGHLVETGVIEGTDAAWLDDLCQRDNFLVRRMHGRRAARAVRLDLAEPRRPVRAPPVPRHMVLAFARNVAPHRRHLHGARHPVPGRAGTAHRLGRARRARRRAGRRRRRRASCPAGPPARARRSRTRSTRRSSSARSSARPSASR